jgi:2-polyprenyl-3-methyl-5-hydroxy-6-metoxy-1,4-benzoquinol methylase
VEPTEHNRQAWDEIHRRRAEALAGQLGIPDPIRERLHVSGKHVLHLQCATGESTAELVELGALVTAVDSSADALIAAASTSSTPGAASSRGSTTFERGRPELLPR